MGTPCHIYIPDFEFAASNKVETAYNYPLAPCCLVSIHKPLWDRQERINRKLDDSEVMKLVGADDGNVDKRAGEMRGEMLF
jgi:hypothetical protein